VAEKQYNVEVVLGVVNKATAELNKFNKQIQDSSETIEKAGMAMTAMGGSIVAAAGVSIKAASEQEQAFSRLQKTIELGGNSWESAKPSIDSFINSLQAASTVSDDELAVSLQKAITYTGNLDDGMRATRIAVDMASSGMFELDNATKLVSLATQGNIQMLGRFIPELKLSGNAMLEQMSTTERAEYALGVLQKRFAGMSANELTTTAGLTKNMKKEFGELAEDIGDKLLPAFNEAVRTMTNVIAGVRSFMQANPMLTSTIVLLTTAVGGMLLAFGSMALALPTVVAHVTALWAVIAAHPLVAVTAAVSALTIGLLNHINAEIEAKNAMINTGKTHADRIKLLQAERAEMAEVLSQGKLTADERAANEQRTLAIIKAIKFEEAQAELEKNATMTVNRQERDAQEMADALAKQQQMATDHKAYVDWIAAIDQENADNQLARWNVQNMTMVGGWKNAMNEMSTAGINFYDKFKGMTNEITGSIASSFAFMVKNIGNGWDVLTQGMQRITDGLMNAVINAFTRMAAEWIVSKTIMMAKTLVWKQTEISANAAVAASGAAAASSWMLWGAIAVGLAVGAAVAGFGGKFAQGGIVPGASYLGDKMMVGTNSGEMILNKSQQARLFDIANGGGSGGGNVVVNVTLSGNYIMDDRTAGALADKVGDVIMDRVRMERNI